MRGQEQDRRCQLRLTPDVLGTSELFPLGCRASRVFCGIVNCWSINRFAVTSYNPYCSYKDDYYQQIHWQEGKPTEGELYRLSQQLRVGDVYIFEGETIDLRNVMGVCSTVEASGQKYHVLMLDFRIEVNPHALQVIRESILLPRGIFLKSGNSYHYYGYNLMSEEQWRMWMSNLSESLGEGGQLHSIIDSQYLEYSLERGYAALRVFRYSGTDKTFVPTVVGYVG